MLETPKLCLGRENFYGLKVLTRSDGCTLARRTHHYGYCAKVISLLAVQ